MFLNIIIPCYNAEKWIGILLKSIFLQTLNDYHVIVVDDMSTDKSAECIQSFSAEISSGKLTFIQNSEKCYQGKSRNIGFKNSPTAEYTWFIDADDYLPRNTVFAELKTAVEQNNCPDVISFQYANDKDGKIFPSPCYKQKIAYDRHFLMLNCTVSPWSKIVKTSQVIDFIETTRWGEDALWTLQLFDNTDSVIDVNGVYYVYRHIENGVTAEANKEIKREHMFTIELEKLLPKVKKVASKINIVRKLAYQYIQFGV